MRDNINMVLEINNTDNVSADTSALLGTRWLGR